jgi:hypothetical protein
VNKVIGILFVDVGYSKVIDNEGKEYWAPFVSSEARGVSASIANIRGVGGVV